MKWDAILRSSGILGFVLAYFIYVQYGTSLEIFMLVIMSIGTLVSPEFIHHLPIGPSK